MNLFDYLNEGFFSLLSSKNKRIYASIILEAYQIYDSSGEFKVEKKIVVDELLLRLTFDANSFTSEEETDLTNFQDVLNYCLRKMEKDGWITVEMSLDYKELLSFTDAGVLMCSTLRKLIPEIKHFDDTNETELEVYNDEYKGFIYTIYSLLTNNDIDNYGYILKEVLRNARELQTSVRMLDSYLRDYLSKVFLETDVKALFENFLLYKADFLNEGYMKIKITDNINRYRIKIISILENYKSDQFILNNLLETYGKNASIDSISRDIDSVIDIFENLTSLIDELDTNTRTYVNSTTAKIKFLLSEDINITGKINNILKFLKDSNKENTLDKNIKLVSSKINLTERKHITLESLSVPRGVYDRDFSNSLATDFDLDLDIDNFVFDLNNKYKEQDLAEWIALNSLNNRFTCSDVLPNTKDGFICIYALLYALRHQDFYDIAILQNRAVHERFSIRDFTISLKEV